MPMTVLTRVKLKEGAEPEWDTAMRERLSTAKSLPGWIGGQLAIPLEAMNERIIIGTWQSRADWEAWHEEDTFAATRKQLEGMELEPSRTEWHEAVLDLRP